MNYSKIYFDHEKLIAYQRSIEFVAWASHLLEEMPSKLAVFDQLERAPTSVPLNIAEGNAKFTAPDRCRYWDTARGSALECSACLDVLEVSLLIGLSKSIAPHRLGEETPQYGISDRE